MYGLLFRSAEHVKKKILKNDIKTFSLHLQLKQMVKCHFQPLISAVKTTNLSPRYTEGLHLVVFLQSLKVLSPDFINIV